MLMYFTVFEISGVFFSGVYFTSIDPYNDPKAILLNNYDDAGHVVNSKRLWAKIKWVVEVCIPINEVKKIPEANRNVYLYSGDFNLSSYQSKIYENPNELLKEKTKK
jgi:hypothetical protein